MDHNTGTVSQFLDKLCYLLHGCNCEFSFQWPWMNLTRVSRSL